MPAKHILFPTVGFLLLVIWSTIGGVGDYLAYASVGLLTLLVSLLDLRHPIHRALALATPLYLIGQTFRYNGRTVPADIVDGVGYLVALVAVLLIIRRRVRHLEKSSALEAVAVGALAATTLLAVNHFTPPDSWFGLQFLPVTGVVLISMALMGRRASPFVAAMIAALAVASTIELGRDAIPPDRINAVSALAYIPVLYAFGLPQDKKRLSFASVPARRRFGTKQQALIGGMFIMPASMLLTKSLLESKDIIFASAVWGLCACAAIALVVRFRLLVQERDWAYSQEQILGGLGPKMIECADGTSLHELVLPVLHQLAGEGSRVGIVEVDSNNTLRPLLEQGQLGVVKKRSRSVEYGDKAVTADWFTSTNQIGGSSVVVRVPNRGTDAVASMFFVCESSSWLHADIEDHFTTVANQYRLALNADELAVQVQNQIADSRFNTLAQDINDLVFLTDPQTGSVRFVGATVERLLGYEQKECLGQDVLQHVFVEDLEIARQLLNAGREMQIYSTVDIRLVLLNGNPRWFEMSVRVLDDEGLDGVLVSFSDINDRKMAGLNVSNSEAKFRALVQNSADVSMLVGATGVISYVSPNVKSIFGHGVNDLVGSELTSFVEPESLSTLRGLFDEADNGGSIRGELVLRASIGSQAKLSEVTVSQSGMEQGEFYAVLARDISERRKLEESLRNRALYDELTGLFHRSAFIHETQSLLQDLEDDASVGTIAINLRDFKQINDSVGFKVGDRVLSAVASRLRATLRPGDKLARLSADEFAVSTVVNGNLESLATRLKAAIEQTLTLDGRDHQLKASFGITTTQDRGASPSELVQQAVVAMRKSRELLDGNPVQFTQSMQDEASARFELAGDLRRAIHEGEFHLVYQPLVDLRNNKVRGFEALLRWNHPERGNIPPNIFIPLAESNGAIVDIGRWVLKAACQALATWRDTYNEFVDTDISVNMSAKQLDVEHELSNLKNIVNASGVGYNHLTIELTESAMVSDAEKIGYELDSLRSSGVSIAIDDFGTGVSGLSHLRELPFDSVKIDKSYVDQLGVTSEGTLLVQQIIELAQGMGAYTVAEGIETPEQAEMLSRMGCDVGQGYYLARPMGENQLIEWIQARAIGNFMNL